MRGKTVFSCICLALICIVGAMHYSHKSSKYSITDLGSLTGNESEANGLNNLGQVVGQSGDTAFIWSRGKMRALTNLSNGDRSNAISINDQGQIVGDSGTGHYVSGPYQIYHAVLWQDEKPTDLGEVLGYPNSAALKINAQSQVAGQGLDQEDGPTVHIYRACSAMFADGVGRETGAEPNGFTLNDKGQRFGSIRRGNRTFLVLWQGGRVLIRSSLPVSERLVASSLNNHGQAAVTVTESGSDDPAPPGPIDAGLWAKGVFYGLPSLPGYPNAYAECVNDLGQIVGEVGEKDRGAAMRPDFKAVLWRSGAVIDLDSVIPTDSGWRLKGAHGINNQGQIVGWGTYQAQKHAFLLTPTGSKH